MAGSRKRRAAEPEREPEPEPARSAAMAPPAWLDGHWGAVPDPEADAACRCGVLEVSHSAGKSAATRLYHQYPLRLIVPRRVKTAFPDADCVWCYSVTFGGGLVAGDRSGMSVDVADGCAAVLATQGTTKIYKHARGGPPGKPPASETITDEASRYSTADAKTSRDTVQALAARVGDGALLAVLPDPAQAFRDSRFRNRQRFALAPAGSLALVDWVTAGRAGFEGGGAGGFTSGYGGGVAPATQFPRDPDGERWVFDSYATAAEVCVDDREVLVESVRLDQTWGTDDGGAGGADGAGGRASGGLAARMGAVHALAVVVLVGPRCEAARRRLAEALEPFAESTVAGGANGVSAAPDPAGDAGWLLASLSDLRVGDDGTAGVVARVAGPDTDSVYRILRTALEPLGRELGAPPFAERGLA
uniref:Urease accessory protein UreD n=1 Tax=Micromonas pusilla TaxID=38833 RepID=A0A7S0IGL8_MICPS|mmetsp:Transcript_5970/g.24658  ORF Transcript_5970/g.24658 Transcript_5970/m.24658 type:complete len:418 (+) Transcript_5970:2036-3289(+)